MARLNAYWTLYEEGRRLSPAEHGRVAENINAHVRETLALNGWPGFPALRRASHLGLPCIRMEAAGAHEARVNVREVQRFVRTAGYTVKADITAAVSRAL